MQVKIQAQIKLNESEYRIIFAELKAEKGVLSPFWGMQLSNLAIIPFAVVSFRKSSW